MEQPRFFKTQAAWQAWLEKNHDKKSELWIGLYKKASGKKGAGYKQLVDEALCYGWIDAIRKNVDEESYMIRFTPRKKNSVWSNVNTNRIKELISEGRVKQAGLHAFGQRDEKRSGIYAFEQEEQKLPPAFEKMFRTNKKAWNWFSAQAPWYRRTAIYKVVSAKQDATKMKRLEALIHYSSQEQTIPELTRSPKKN